MPVYKMDKLPPDHPFAGTRIVFGAKRPDASAKNSTTPADKAPSSNPMAGAEETIEAAYQEQFGDQYLGTPEDKPKAP